MIIFKPDDLVRHRSVVKNGKVVRVNKEEGVHKGWPYVSWFGQGSCEKLTDPATLLPGRYP